MKQIALPDGYPTTVRMWTPTDPRGAVLYFHGIQSHGGWYEPSGRRLADAGFTVFMPDRRGSGLNPPPRGHYADLDQCLSDTRCMLDALLRETRQASAHIVGVSWGGKQAVYLAQAMPEKVRSVTLVGPGLFPRVDLTIGEKVRVGISMINDREKLFDIPLNDPRAFTANPDRMKFVEDDALKLLQVSASFLLTSRRLDKLLRAFPQSAYLGPIHLFLAGRDRIINNEQTRAWFDALPSPDRTLAEYPEGEHTLEFEADPTRFFSDLVEWIARRA